MMSITHDLPDSRWRKLEAWLDRAFSGKRRKNGDSMAQHSKNVGRRLAARGLDDVTVFAGYCHDVLEDTDLTAEALRAVAIDVLGSAALADEAVALVVEVSYSDAEYALAKPERKSVACRRWIDSPNPRVAAVKMADVEDNLSTADLVSEAFGREYRAWAEPLYAALARKHPR